MTIFDQYFNRDSLISAGFWPCEFTFQDVLDSPVHIDLMLSPDKEEELLDALWDAVQDELWQLIGAQFPDGDIELMRNGGWLAEWTLEQAFPDHQELLQTACKRVFKDLKANPKKWRRQHEATWQGRGFDSFTF